MIGREGADGVDDGASVMTSSTGDDCRAGGLGLAGLGVLAGVGVDTGLTWRPSLEASRVIKEIKSNLAAVAA